MPACGLVIIGMSTIAAAAPTTATLASDLASSTGAREPKRFLKPLIGLMRPRLGLRP